jgi:hypothetical protein
MDTDIGQLPRFRRYGNPGNRSGVEAYSLLARGVAIRFADGSVLLYDHDCPGPQHVEKMKELARSGRGLGTYLGRHVGRRYASRLDGTGAPPRRYDTRQNTAFR